MSEVVFFDGRNILDSKNQVKPDIRELLAMLGTLGTNVCVITEAGNHYDVSVGLDAANLHPVGAVRKRDDRSQTTQAILSWLEMQGVSPEAAALVSEMRDGIEAGAAAHLGKVIGMSPDGVNAAQLTMAGATDIASDAERVLLMVQ